MATADKLIEDSSTSAHRFRQSVAIGAYAFSVFAKAAERNKLWISTTDAAAIAIFDLALGVVESGTGVIEDVGGGWYRCSANATTVNTNGVFCGIYNSAISYTGDGTSGIYIWGAQLEAGSFPTSYIKTTSSTVTRAADSASMTGTDFSDWYNQAEGTIVVDGVTSPGIGASGNQYLASLSDGTNNNLIFVNRPSSNAASAGIITSGSTQTAFSSFSTASNQRISAALALKADNCAITIGGAEVQTDSSVTLPSVNRLVIGNRADGARAWNGTIASIAYYPKRLSNSQLQFLTS